MSLTGGGVAAKEEVSESTSVINPTNLHERRIKTKVSRAGLVWETAKLIAQFTRKGKHYFARDSLWGVIKNG